MQTYRNSLSAALNLLNLKDVETLRKRIDAARFVWIIGNGGSMSTATHFAEDLLKMRNKAALAISDSSLLTMCANDEGWENVFAFPLSRLANTSDLIIGLTTSGKSENIVRTASFIITGIGGKLLSNPKIIIPSTDCQIIEDITLMIVHMICRS